MMYILIKYIYNDYADTGENLRIIDIFLFNSEKMLKIM